ncbi:MAG: hypothetical protein ACK5D9_15140, partial [Burkholderiales bacterium]
MTTVSPAEPAPRKRRILLWVGLPSVAIAVAAGVWIWWTGQATPPGLLQLNGRIEGDQIMAALGSPTQSRMRRLRGAGSAGETVVMRVAVGLFVWLESGAD